MLSPQMPFCVYDVNISFRVIKGDNLQKFTAITPQIQESRYSGTSKTPYSVLFLCSGFFVKFQKLVFVDFVHTVKILPNEKKAYCDIQKIHRQHRKQILYTNGISGAATVSDMKRTQMDYFSIFSLVSTLI